MAARHGPAASTTPHCCSTGSASLRPPGRCRVRCSAGRAARRPVGLSEFLCSCVRLGTRETGATFFRGRIAPERRTVKLRCFTRSCEKMCRLKTRSASRAWALQLVLDYLDQDLPWGVGTGERTAGFRSPHLLRIDQTWTKSASLPGGTRPDTPHHHVALWLRATVQMLLRRVYAQGGV